jgi:hypothetical protein
MCFTDTRNVAQEAAAKQRRSTAYQRKNTSPGTKLYGNAMFQIGMKHIQGAKSCSSCGKG